MPSVDDHRKAAARNMLARDLRRMGMAYTRFKPDHPDPLTEWGDFLTGPTVGARSVDEARAAFRAIMDEARDRRMAVQFARHVLDLGKVGKAAILRLRGDGGPAMRATA